MAVDDHQVSQGEFRAELVRKQEGCYVREESEAMEKVARTVARYFRPLAAVSRKIPLDPIGRSSPLTYPRGDYCVKKEPPLLATLGWREKTQPPAPALQPQSFHCH